MASGVFYVDPNNSEQGKGVVIREGVNKNKTVQEKLEELEAMWSKASFSGTLTTENITITGAVKIITSEHLYNNRPGKVGPLTGGLNNAKVLILDNNDILYYTTVRDLLEAGGMKDYLSLDGGKMRDSATISISAPITNAAHVVNKEYLDFNIVNNLLKNYVEGDLGFEFYPQNTPAQSLPAPKSKLVTAATVKDSISKLITVSATQPTGSNFQVGALWIDTGGKKNNFLRYWTGTGWAAVPVAWT